MLWSRMSIEQSANCYHHLSNLTKIQSAILGLRMKLWNWFRCTRRKIMNLRVRLMRNRLFWDSWSLNFYSLKIYPARQRDGRYCTKITITASILHTKNIKLFWGWHLIPPPNNMCGIWTPFKIPSCRRDSWFRRITSKMSSGQKSRSDTQKPMRKILWLLCIDFWVLSS